MTERDHAWLGPAMRIGCGLQLHLREAAARCEAGCKARAVRPRARRGCGRGVAMVPHQYTRAVHQERSQAGALSEKEGEPARRRLGLAHRRSRW